MDGISRFSGHASPMSPERETNLQLTGNFLDLPKMGRSILGLDKPKELSMITFRVPDMTCGHCASAIAKANAADDAGAQVEFDIPAHLVRVITSAASPAELAQAIRDSGYTASEQTQARPRAGGCGCGCGPAKSQPIDLPQPATASRGGCCG